MENKINGETKILGVIGDPIEHSRSPQIHNTICKHLNLNYAYLPFRITLDNLEDAVKGFKAIDLQGFNVTLPHKKNIIPYLDEVSEEALLIGAVNTVKNINGKLYGYNTDGYGFIKSLKMECVSVTEKNIVVLGAGGAAQGICIKMALEGAKSITILNRTVEKAEKICHIINDNIKQIAQSDEFNDEKFKEYMEVADILIHTTPVGMYPDVLKSPVNDLSFLDKSVVVCDLIYNPTKTVFLQKAEEVGCKTINGWGMLIYQAIRAFEIWTDVQVENDVIEIVKGQV